MKRPSLQKTAALSAVLHVTFFILSAAILKQTTQIAIPSPYIVSLVGPVSEQRKILLSRAEESAQPDTNYTAAEKNTAKGEEKIDAKRIDQRIAEIESEIASKRMLERRVKLRTIVSIRGGEKKSIAKVLPQKGNTAPVSASQSPAGSLTYEDKIRDEIHDKWRWPDNIEKNLETIVTVMIRKDGTIPMQNIVIEKKSGSRLFDRQALQAIAKASPVTPPPYNDFPIGLRFFP